MRQASGFDPIDAQSPLMVEVTIGVAAHAIAGAEPTVGHRRFAGFGVLPIAVHQGCAAHPKFALIAAINARFNPGNRLPDSAGSALALQRVSTP